jgi:hypothetical protein
MLLAPIFLPFQQVTRLRPADASTCVPRSGPNQMTGSFDHERLNSSIGPKAKLRIAY